MSWLFSQVLVEEYLEASNLDGAPFVPSNMTSTPEMYLSHGKTTEVSNLSRYGMTCKRSMDDLGEELLTWYLVDFPAKIYRSQEKASESMANGVGYGAKWRELSVRYDRDSCGWRTHQCLFDEGLPESSVILPKWGMTVDGVLWERTTPALRTSEKGSGYWLTPRASDYKGASGEKACENTIRRFGSPSNLPEHVISVHYRLWPTVKCQDERAALRDRGKGNLGEEVHEFHGEEVENGGRLNPNWCEFYLMGWPPYWTDIQKNIDKELMNEWEKLNCKRRKEESTEEIHSGKMRNMRQEGEPSQTPQRQKPYKQRKEKHTNSLCILPRENSRNGQMEKPFDGNKVCLLRKSIHKESLKTGNMLSFMREQACMGKSFGCFKESTTESAGQGEVKKMGKNWIDDPADTGEVPRVTTEKAYRSHRIKCIGNGQVPQAMRLAFEILRTRE